MKPPKLERMSSSGRTSRAIVIIQGAWSEDHDSSGVWLESLKASGWREAVYHLQWDSSRVYIDDFEKSLTWKRIKNRADEVGKDFFDGLISEIPEKEISIVAYSAGARIAYYGLKKWTNYHHELKDAILLAGALRRDDKENWGCAASKLSGHLVNVYNRDDPAMKQYKKGAWGNSPCGRKPIKEKHSKIINIEATDSIGKTHSVENYLAFLPCVARSGYWHPKC